MIARIRAWLAHLWLLIKSRSRTTWGALVAFLATAVPWAIDQLPGIQQFAATLPLEAAVLAKIQLALQVGGAGLALWQKVFDSQHGRAAGWRIDQARQ